MATTLKNDLGSLYLQMLEMGFIVLKEAARRGEHEWVEAELELLHNIPSLVSETNMKRHAFFWNGERAHYLERMEKLDIPDAQTRRATYYEPLWEKMKPFLEEAGGE